MRAQRGLSRRTFFVRVPPWRQKTRQPLPFAARALRGSRRRPWRAAWGVSALAVGVGLIVLQFLPVAVQQLLVQGRVVEVVVKMPHQLIVPAARVEHLVTFWVPMAAQLAVR